MRNNPIIVQKYGGACLETPAKIRAVASSLAESLTCFGGVSSDLPFKAIQILQHHGIIADKYVLSPHSVNLFVPVESREAAVKALHSLI
jgi:aspartate kinase